MKRFFIFLLFVTYCSPLCATARVEIHEGQFYVDGEPFYIRAVGYNSLRPHQHPGATYSGVNYNWIDHDFERIKAANFNTIRTWDALEPQELELARKHGLMVIQGIWLDPKQDFSDPHNQDSCVRIVQSVAEQSKPFDNILAYAVMTEPSAQAIFESGVPATEQFFRRLKRSLQTVDPRPVGMDSWLPIAFLDHSMWDFAMFNAFAFAPKSINHALGFAGYVRWLADRFAQDRPFIVGETGGYAVSKSSFSILYGGMGGLDEYNQSLKDLDSLRGSVEGHANGSVLVSWIDTWYYPKDPDVHNTDEPWEWDGVLGIPTDSKKDMDGIPRRVYADVTAHNEVVVLEPKNNHIYPLQEKITIYAVAAPNVVSMQYNLNDSDWLPLEGPGRGGWHGFFKLPKMARRRLRLNVRGLDKDGTTVGQTKVSFLTAVPAEHVSIGPASKSGSMNYLVTVTDDAHKRIPQRKVYYGFFYPISWTEAQGVVMTDAYGQATITCPIFPQGNDRLLFVAAGTDSTDRVRTGDMKIVKTR